MEQVDVHEVLDEYQGWGKDVVSLLSCMSNIKKWRINVVYPPLPSYFKGAIALMGDAVSPVYLYGL